MTARPRPDELPPVRRPEGARPRSDAAPMVEPPTPAELAAIQRHLITLPGQEGAQVVDDEQLGVTFVRGPGSGPDLTYAAMPRWDPASWSTALAAVRARMLDDGVWPSLLLCDGLDTGPDVASELARDGWMPVTGETVLWVGHASVVPHLDAGLRIEAVRPSTVDVHEALERHVFGVAAEQAGRRREAMAKALADQRLRAWIVRLEGEPVAVARLSQGDGVAGLQGIGVVAERRGRGYGRLITTVATRAGLATGARIVWLSVRGDNAAALATYAGLGFERAFSWTRWLVTADPRHR